MSLDAELSGVHNRAGKLSTRLGLLLATRSLGKTGDGMIVGQEWQTLSRGRRGSDCTCGGRTCPSAARAAQATFPSASSERGQFGERALHAVRDNFFPATKRICQRMLHEVKWSVAQGQEWLDDCSSGLGQDSEPSPEWRRYQNNPPNCTEEAKSPQTSLRQM